MAIGIVCEYNPFHNGHLYHLNKVKEMFKDEEIVLVLSGNYVQRGDFSIIEKYDKASIALKYGVNLVAELPFSFLSSSSDYFSKGAIGILEKLKCRYVVFGSENGDINTFTTIANDLLNNKEYDNLVKKYLSEGKNYPTSLSLALKDLTNKDISRPNDLLALSYVKEIIKNNYKIKPITIQRTTNYNSDLLEGEVTSATSIRKAILDKKDISLYVPEDTLKYIDRNDYREKYFNLLKYKILSDKDLTIYEGVCEGLDKRILKYIDRSRNIDELIFNIKTKRYTYNKINRMLAHIFTSFTKSDAINNHNLKYIRVLGFDSKGRKYLNSIKKDIDIEIITNITKEKYHLLKDDIKYDKLYYLIKGIDKNPLKDKPVIKD